MAYDEKALTAPRPHALSMEDRCRLTVTGVEDVLSFDETDIVMKTAQGDLSVHGSGLHIGKISLDVGELKVEGTISELRYEEPVQQGGFFARLFG